MASVDYVRANRSGSAAHPVFSNQKPANVQRSARTGRLVVVDQGAQKARAKKLGLKWYL